MCAGFLTSLKGQPKFVVNIHPRVIIMVPVGVAMIFDEEDEARELVDAYNVIMMHEDSKIVLRWVWRAAVIASIVAAFNSRWWDIGIFAFIVALGNLFVPMWYIREARKKTGMPQRIQSIYYHRYQNDPAFHEAIDEILARHVRLTLEVKAKGTSKS